jgi:hypothetical protein
LKDPYIFDFLTKPTIGLILCQDKNPIIAEYALKGVKKAIGVSAYQLTRALPKEFRSSKLLKSIPGIRRVSMIPCPSRSHEWPR